MKTENNATTPVLAKSATDNASLDEPAVVVGPLTVPVGCVGAAVVGKNVCQMGG